MAFKNNGYVPDDFESNSNEETQNTVPEETEKRQSWGNEIEFLFSCIALSVGLGNIWRFPFVALENGGGAFVIPYIIVLLLVGKPVYFMEMSLGQFSSSNSVKVYNCVPILKGIGMGQVISTCFVATYYSSIMAITLRYLIDSFKSVLPWSVCDPDWGPCVPSSSDNNLNSSLSFEAKSSAELYFINEVTKAKENILDGIGAPIWNLVALLFLTWLVVFLTLLKGIKSSGKASYVFAIFPYIVLITLFIRSLTLEGAFNGIKYFFTPQWDKILTASVWYAAVTQVFFSLNIFFGSIVMYSSYNKFDHNISRDAKIVTILDTVTSLTAGCCIFGIVGHLSYVLDVDIPSVVEKGPGLAFVTYPNAISKIKFVPQLFAALFFIMLFILGIGTLLAMTTCVTTLIKDQFRTVKHWQAALGFTVFGFLSGIVYLTPGGQSVLQLVDFYGATFVAFILALGQLLAFCFIYGVKRMAKDIQFMLGFYPNYFWTICWQFITPGLMLIIVIFTLWSFELPRDGNHDYPVVAHAVGWCLATVGLAQLPIFAIYEVFQQKDERLWEKIKNAFRPSPTWGPRDKLIFQKYKESLSN